jgi:hypothetical protein
MSSDSEHGAKSLKLPVFGRIGRSGQGAIAGLVMKNLQFSA